MDSGRPAKFTNPLERLSMRCSGGPSRPVSTAIPLRLTSRMEQNLSLAPSRNRLNLLPVPPLSSRVAFCVSPICPTTPSTASADMKQVKAIHAQESRAAADRKARAIVDDLRAAKMNTAADLVERSVSETLTYYAFPDIHWQKIRTNNPLERIMKEIRRRTRVVGAFPDGQSCLNLAAARLRYIAGTAWSEWCDTRRRKGEPTGNTNIDLNRRVDPRPYRNSRRQ